MTKQELNALTGNEKKEAKALLWETIKKACLEVTEATEALKALRPSLFGSTGSTGGAGKPAKYLVFSGLFEKVGDTIDELEVFKELHVGRKEARTLIKDSIRKVELDNRKWITFDPETGVYELVSIGADSPKDWTGYEPEEVIDEDDLI